MKTIGALGLLAVIGAIGFSLSRTVIADSTNFKVRPAPALAAGNWVNGRPTTIAAQRGKVVVLAFWTRDCINCEHTLPYWNDWAKRYGADSNVSVITVHSPETDSERDLSGLKSFVAAKDLCFPVLTDNDHKTWDAFGIDAWPATVLIDKHGQIRYEFEGELNWEGSGEYKQVEKDIETLRSEPA